MTSTNSKRPAHWNNDQQFFYKYMSRSTGKIVLENGTLRWSTPATLNDPYDMQFDLHMEVDHETVKALALQKLWDAFYGEKPVQVGNALGVTIQFLKGKMPRLKREEFNQEYGEAIDEGFARLESALPGGQEEIRLLMAKSKVLCLSEAPDNPIMWAHYAEQHHGLVLRFRSIPEFDSPWCVARPVEYLEQMPRLLDNDFLAEMASGQVSFNAKELMNRLIYTKSVEWAYEREWRISIGAGRGPNAPYEDITFHNQELDAVILGCVMLEEDRKVFVELTKSLYPHASILEAKKSDRKFQFDIGKLEV